MRLSQDSFISLWKQAQRNFVIAVFNILTFWPHFFSVKQLLRTLIVPWKGTLPPVKDEVGFSFHELGKKISAQLTARGLGFLIRAFTLVLFMVVFITWLILLPIFMLIHLIFSSLVLLVRYYLLGWKPTNAYLKARQTFIKNHSLNPSATGSLAADWFDNLWGRYQLNERWWSKQKLSQIHPLAKDWAFGFTPQLDQYSQDLTSGGYQSQTANVLDRQKEITLIESVLTQSMSANVIVVGKAGVGKHTIIDALAKRIYTNQVGPHLTYKRIVKLDMDKITAGVKDQDEAMALLDQLFNEAAHAGNIIIFIDSFDRYVKFQPIFVKYGMANKVQIIATTTPVMYERLIAPHDKLRSLLDRVDVYEVSPELALEILLTVALTLEDRHKLVIPYETIKQAIDRSQFFITHIPFPEKAIELLDQACILAVNQKVKQVLPEHIDKTLANKFQVPVTLSEDWRVKLAGLESFLKQRVIGQDPVINEIITGLQTAFLHLGDRTRPLTSFLFLGPTGVGKTLTAKLISQHLFGLTALVRFDMTNFKTLESVTDLLGSSGDGSYQPGLLTQALKKVGHGVLLLDEIEKAHPDLNHIFMSILDEGYFTNNAGQRVNCRNFVVIATSNAGSQRLYHDSWQGNQLAFVDSLIEAGIFAAEFLNRFDKILLFNFLTQPALAQIAWLYFNQAKVKYEDQYGIKLKLSPSTQETIIKQAQASRFGARYLAKLVQETVDKLVVKLVIGNQVVAGQELVI